MSLGKSKRSEVLAETLVFAVAMVPWLAVPLLDWQAVQARLLFWALLALTLWAVTLPYRTHKQVDAEIRQEHGVWAQVEAAIASVPSAERQGKKLYVSSDILDRMRESLSRMRPHGAAEVYLNALLPIRESGGLPSGCILIWRVD